jgi:hypothetical protein
MLLAVHSMGLGAPVSYELMAVVALGHPVKKNRFSERKELSQLVFREKFGQG